MDQLILAFVTGLTAGGLSCIALQGGLLASVVLDDENEYLKDKGHKQPPKARPIVLFLIAKLLTYSVLGFLLGVLGSFISLSPIVRGYLQVLIGIFIIGVALHILKVHPIFRYFSIQPPKALRKYIRKQTKHKGDLGALFMGALTVFIPCAVTQATMLIAVSSGSGLYGAAIMFSFILGTSPVFFVLGYLATSLSERLNRVFLRILAVLVIFMGVFSIVTGASLAGIRIPDISVSKEASQEECTGSACPVDSKGSASEPEIVNGVQAVTINITDDDGYVPNKIRVKKNVPVKVTLKTQKTFGCARAFVIPSLNIQKILPQTGEETFEFTPDKKGTVDFSCSMGMYTGSFEVAE
ncbi:sulfite exporter TauE/SafE family protein [candidate division WS5 bacterium]|uniref:Sulfite exporter TauE/SafE family protein n=1 Tax=candidate division WS5 bacterium TaxID=2093353 RepID=A0A419DFK8_9BACT|nr:MAG: sulfite exporter TauE/SafE family protein [candidate division WS5 bacterium]